MAGSLTVNCVTALQAGNTTKEIGRKCLLGRVIMRRQNKEALA